MSQVLYQVTLPYACFGIVTDDLIQGKVTEAAPIGKWMIGKRLSTVIAWVNGKGGKVEYVGPSN
jgi:hypothetical protein